MSAPRRLAREALRLFPLIGEDGWLEPQPAAWPDPVMSYVLRGPFRSGSSAARKIPAADVDDWMSQGWIDRDVDGDCLRLNGAGRAWLRRQLAGAEPFQEQHQHRAMEHRLVETGQLRPVLVNQAESPLGWLRRRKDRNGRSLLDEGQYQAGERLREDFWRAGLSARVTSNPGAPPPGRRMRRGPSDGGLAVTEAAMAAKQRIERAMCEVGPELSGILLNVCCFSHGLEQVEETNGWPQRAGKVVLQIALTRLARHYGIIVSPEPGSQAKAVIRSWGTPDYQPTTDRWK
ncbi:MAG: DUF6456 domain-containing protein [Pseudomonadota bacterium]|nr:DUF6456 domain-containing protein [Pseudomonadota bacterium]